MTDGLEWRDDPIGAESDEGMEGLPLIRERSPLHTVLHDQFRITGRVEKLLTG